MPGVCVQVHTHTHTLTITGWQATFHVRRPPEQGVIKEEHEMPKTIYAFCFWGGRRESKLGTCDPLTDPFSAPFSFCPLLCPRALPSEMLQFFSQDRSWCQAWPLSEQVYVTSP